MAVIPVCLTTPIRMTLDLPISRPTSRCASGAQASAGTLASGGRLPYADPADGVFSCLKHALVRVIKKSGVSRPLFS